MRERLRSFLVSLLIVSYLPRPYLDRCHRRSALIAPFFPPATLSAPLPTASPFPLLPYSPSQQSTAPVFAKTTTLFDCYSARRRRTVLGFGLSTIHLFRWGCAANRECLWWIVVSRRKNNHRDTNVKVTTTTKTQTTKLTTTSTTMKTNSQPCCKVTFSAENSQVPPLVDISYNPEMNRATRATINRDFHPPPILCHRFLHSRRFLALFVSTLSFFSRRLHSLLFRLRPVFSENSSVSLFFFVISFSLLRLLLCLLFSLPFFSSPFRLHRLCLVDSLSLSRYQPPSVVASRCVLCFANVVFVSLTQHMSVRSTNASDVSTKNRKALIQLKLQKLQKDMFILRSLFHS